MENQLKATELRIGNLVFSPDDNQNISITGCDIFMLENNHHREMKFSPIQLTEDILVKLGFYNDNGFWCLNINNTAFMTIILSGSYANYELSNFRQKIFFSRGTFAGLHQLQNLFFSLTSEEITFKN